MARILVIDDERHIRELYSLELTTEGYSVETKASCADLLSVVEHSKPNAIILDIRLVDDDGLEVLLKLRGIYPDLPVIMCTAYDSYRYDVRAAAADAYVVKSFDLGELKMKIKLALEGQIPPSPALLPGSDEAPNGKGQKTVGSAT